MLSHYWCKRLESFLILNCRNTVYSSAHLRFLDGVSLIDKFFSSKTKSKDEQRQQHHKTSLRVSYLIDACGLSPEKAKSVSKRVNFHSSENPDAVLDLLRNHGFTNSQIAIVVKNRPYLLLKNADEAILPKLKFFYSIGLTKTDLPRIISYNTTILACSLENQLVPSYNLLKSVLHSDANVVTTLKCGKSWIITQNLHTNFVPNMSLLRELGVPQSYISLLIMRHPNVACRNAKKFAEGVKEVIKMGLDPKHITFVKALAVFCEVSKLAWEEREAVYRSWGWSKEEVVECFKKMPNIMLLSEKNIRSKMDFIVNKMGWPSAYVASKPVILTYCLEKRVIPRCAVLRALQLKGLIKEGYSILTMLVLSEKNFFDRFVLNNQKNFPELLSIFQGKDVPPELDFGFESKS